MTYALASGKTASRPLPADPRTVGIWMRGWQDQVLDGGAASLKSTEIPVRGMKIWNAALIGVVSMSLDDAMAARRARLSCRTLDSRLRLERDLAPRALRDAVVRMTLLARVALHLGEDACYPLQRCPVVLLETLTCQSWGGGRPPAGRPVRAGGARPPPAGGRSQDGRSRDGRGLFPVAKLNIFVAERTDRNGPAFCILGTQCGPGKCEHR